MIQDKLAGTGVAIVTPFRTDMSVDFNAFSKLINYIIDNGVNYLVILGTTGETVTLTKEEKTAIINYAIEIIDKRVPLVIGMGCNNTQELLSSIDLYDFEHIDAILSVTPYYNKPTQEGLIRHYTAFANESPRPIILYNVPGRTGVNLTAESTLTLAKHKNICAIKEASGDFGQALEIIKHAPEDFSVISGDDGISLPLISIGAKGVISVIGNALPLEFSSMIKLALDGNFKEANEKNLKLSDLYKHLFVEGNPGGVKSALNILGLIENHLRLPLLPVSNKNHQTMIGLINKIKEN